MEKLLMVALLGLASPAAAESVKKRSDSPWFADYQTAKTAARRSGKPMLVVFR